MSVLKRKSSIALITGIIIVLLLIPLWYMMLAPSIIFSQLEKINIETSFEGTLHYSGYGPGYGPGSPWYPIRIEAHVYATEVKGDNIILRIDAVTKNITDPDNPNELEYPFSYNKTYVFNKRTLENVRDAPDSDNPNRTGYDPLYPSHLKAGEDIDNAWLENLNTTATLEYVGRKKEGGLTLYKYFVNVTITKEMSLPNIGLRNCTLISSKTILLEPLSGLRAYTENEVLVVYMLRRPGEAGEPLLLVDLTYESTAEAKADGLATAKTAYEGLQLLELYIPSLLGLIAIILIVGLAFNVRRLKRKLTSLKT